MVLAVGAKRARCCADCAGECTLDFDLKAGPSSCLPPTAEWDVKPQGGTQSDHVILLTSHM
jgi:hypothetical protein